MVDSAMAMLQHLNGHMTSLYNCQWISWAKTQDIVSGVSRDRKGAMSATNKMNIFKKLGNSTFVKFNTVVEISSGSTESTATADNAIPDLPSYFANNIFKAPHILHQLCPHAFCVQCLLSWSQFACNRTESTFSPFEPVTYPARCPL